MSLLLLYFNENNFLVNKIIATGFSGKPDSFTITKKIDAYEHKQYKSTLELLKEQGYKVKRILILRIGRDETEGFEERYITRAQITKFFEIFKNLIKIYYLKKELNWK